MSLTKTQIEAIANIIKERFTRFTYEALGERALTPAEIEELSASGLVRNNLRNLVADPVILGKVLALMPPSARSISYDELLSFVNKNGIPLTEVEQQSIDYATEHAGQYISGIRDMAIRDVRAMSARSSGEALRKVQEGVSEAIANRETTSELKTRLFDTLDDRTRDWQRVAHTEMNTAIQNGIYQEIRDKSPSGGDQLVFKRPAPDACKYCKKLYLDVDGVTPKIFKMTELAESNIGMKAPDWQPTIGSVHPWCHCQLYVLPEGFSFVKKRVATEPVRGFKTGQVVEESKFSSLGEKDKSKVKWDAVLAYTGETRSE